jgi:8-oxo-dGTP pyrophosphatase MutT (NUDIX family)
MKKEFQNFWVSQSATWIKDGKCLILESCKRPGYWGLIGGRIDTGELADEAFRRELKEELDLDHFKKLGLVDYLLIYENSSGVKFPNPICLIVQLIESDQVAAIHDLSEHQNLAWISVEDIDNYKYVALGLDHIIRKAFDIYNRLPK